MTVISRPHVNDDANARYLASAKHDQVPRLHEACGEAVLIGRERHAREGLQCYAMHREPPLSIHPETGCAGDARLEDSPKRTAGSFVSPARLDPYGNAACGSARDPFAP